MKKLLILAPPVPPYHLGGDGKFALDIALELSRRNIEIILFSPSYNKPFDDKSLNKHLRSVRVPINHRESKDGWDFPIWEPKFTKKRDSTFLKHLDNLNFDRNDMWIHEIGGSIYNSLLIKLVREKQIPYSCHVQFVLANYDKSISNDRPYKQLTLISQKEYIKNARLAMFLSEMDAQPFDLKHYSVVPNGVDLEEYFTHRNEPINGQYKIFIGGRLYSQMKGTEKIFPILSKLLTKISQTEIHICAPDKTHFDLFDKSVRNRVIYHGWTSVKKTQQVIQNCDVSIVPSIYEPFGLLALESLANGIPVLATRTGGLSGMIKPGINGEFINLDNPKEIEEIILKLVNLKDKNKKYNPNKIRESIQKYDISEVGDLYLKNIGPFIGIS